MEAAKVIVLVLERRAVQFELVDDQDEEWLVVSTQETEIGTVRCLICLRRNPLQVAVMAYHPLTIVSALRPQLQELLTYINNQLVVGAFRLDLNDGMLRFQIGIDCEHALLHPLQLDNNLELAFGTLLRAHRAIILSLYDGLPAYKALEHF